MVCCINVSAFVFVVMTKVNAVILIFLSHLSKHKFEMASQISFSRDIELVCDIDQNNFGYLSSFTKKKSFYSRSNSFLDTSIPFVFSAFQKGQSEM